MNKVYVCSISIRYYESVSTEILFVLQQKEEAKNIEACFEKASDRYFSVKTQCDKFMKHYRIESPEPIDPISPEEKEKARIIPFNRPLPHPMFNRMSKKEKRSHPGYIRFKAQLAKYEEDVRNFKASRKESDNLFAKIHLSWYQSFKDAEEKFWKENFNLLEFFPEQYRIYFENMNKDIFQNGRFSFEEVDFI